MSELTPADLANLRRLLAAATPGWWETDPDSDVPRQVYSGRRFVCVANDHNPTGNRDFANAALIAALVNAAPALIEMAERAVRDPSAGHPATCRCTACFPG